MSWSSKLLDIEMEIHRHLREHPEAHETQPFKELGYALTHLIQAWNHIRAYEIETGRE